MQRVARVGTGDSGGRKRTQLSLEMRKEAGPPVREDMVEMGLGWFAVISTHAYSLHHLAVAH